MGNYFYRVSNNLIRSSPVNVKKICVNYLIGEGRGINDCGMTSLQYLIESCGYSSHRGTGRINNLFRQLVTEMIDNGTLILLDNYKCLPKHLSFGIPYIVNSDKFDVLENFTKLYDNEFDVLIRKNPECSCHNKENLLSLYLYIKSYFCQGDGATPSVGFYQSLDTIQKSLGFSPRIAIKLFEELVDKRLLIKHYTGAREYIKGGKKIKENVPNIYVPRLDQTEAEIEKTINNTIEIMKGIYGVDEFLSFMKDLRDV